MSVLEAIKRRRSVFPDQYDGKPITKAAIETILESANWAPTHKRTEPWRFKVLLGDKKKELGEFLSKKYQETATKPKQMKTKKLLENPQKAGAIIAICMQHDMEDRLPEWEEVAATAMAVQNMWLCCSEMGIGAYWSSPPLIKFMGEFFEMAEGEVCLGFFYMGYSNDESPEGTRNSTIADKTVWLD